jgi:hypothetical protein
MKKMRHDSIRNPKNSKVPVAHACNPSYSGGRDQEDWGSKPARANRLWDPISKKPSQKWAGGLACGVGLEPPKNKMNPKNKIDR